MQLSCVLNYDLYSTFVAELYVVLRFMPYGRRVVRNELRVLEYNRIECGRTAKITIVAPPAFFWSYLHTYLFHHVCITILVIPKIVSNDLIRIFLTGLAIHISLYDLNMQYK